MTETGYRELHLNNPGVLLKQIPSSIFETLQSKINGLSNHYRILSKLNAPNHGTGGIEKVFNFEMPNSLREFILNFAKDYVSHFNMKLDPILGQSWVNLMEKHEYNAVHAHGHVGLTFVIWITIPYDLGQEDSYKNNSSAVTKKNSRFEFIYSRLDGFIQTLPIPVDTTYEGTIMMFPSYLGHVVYPFYTSNGLRISLSGNLSFDKAVD